ncbi:NmrA family transcriptional regulator [Peziza echinospora]|nr:NmrA family transcriptional regulator [Peziza echinospora]
MSKLLVVFGATGNQGGSVVDFVLNHPELSKQYKVRGITRDATNPKAQALEQKGVEVVAADFDDDESIKKALEGANAVFATTVSILERGAKEKAVNQGKAIADAAVAAGADYIIWSTIPNATKGSGGKLVNVEFFDARELVDEYIRTLPIKATFWRPGAFMQNVVDFWRPRPVGDGTYVVAGLAYPDTEVPLIDVVGDSGKWIGSFLLNPDKYDGKTIASATRFYTYTEIVETISKVTGKTVKYQNIPDEVFLSFLPPSYGVMLYEMNLFQRDFGAFGEKGKEALELGAAAALGTLTTFEEYLKKNPLNLD